MRSGARQSVWAGHHVGWWRDTTQSVPLAIARSSGRHFRPLDYLEIQFVIPPEI